MLGSATKDIDTTAWSPKAGRTSAVSHLPKPGAAEFAFLLRLLSCGAGAEPPSFPAGAHAELLWEYIERHGLGGLMGGCVDRAVGLPAGLAEAARRRYWSNYLHGRQARECCAAILDAGSRTGIQLFFVKGPALIDQAYDDDGWRGFGDLDLFTGSADEARRLATACGARVRIDSERQSIWREIWDAGRVVAELEGWPIEIRFPVAGWSGPLYDLFPDGRLPDVIRTASGLPAPAPEWHFLFLLQHLMGHHFFGRFIWFVDLAALMHRERVHLNWDRIVAVTRRVGMYEALAAAADFCREHIQPSFPHVASPPGGGWNRPFIRHLVRPEVIIASRRNKQQVSAARRFWAVLHGACNYFLLSDTPPEGQLRAGRGWQWTAARVRDVLTRRWSAGWARWLACRLSCLVPWFIYPLSRALGRIPCTTSRL